MNSLARSMFTLLLAGGALSPFGTLVLGCGPPSEVRAPGPEDGPPGPGGPGGPGRPGRRPPEEAVAACNGKSPGDACSFKLGDGEIKGLCDNPPSDPTMACRPSGPPPGAPPGGPPGGPGAPPGGPGGPPGAP